MFLETRAGIFWIKIIFGVGWGPLLKLLMMLGTGTRYIVPGSTRVTHRPCARHRPLLLYGCNNAMCCTFDGTR